MGGKIRDILLALVGIVVVPIVLIIELIRWWRTRK
tara:strand:- start:56 stop:160 length:105 start_codon:yes stop_codon:yes gene_type:complete